MNTEQPFVTCIAFIGDPEGTPLKVDTPLDSVWEQWCERASTFDHACMPVPIRLTNPTSGEPMLINPAAIAYAWQEGGPNV